jgi:hypothetical protein
MDTTGRASDGRSLNRAAVHAVGHQQGGGSHRAFNAFNWFLPGNPTVNLSSATFGRITSFSGAANPRVMQFALRYLF